MLLSPTGPVYLHSDPSSHVFKLQDAGVERSLNYEMCVCMCAPVGINAVFVFGSV